ncbi:hypothetical protein B9Z55_021864 [Caenorhabditis nigoni]|uniref:Uncharacterized protein n=1 Tax=Caenorhabditis nigoni TaxID=1611254 RepID=A0A2G5TTY2_9PELO|nr:hypothetical protein B9Z55_021864 [Caenorhabditis nigoni]
MKGGGRGWPKRRKSIGTLILDVCVSFSNTPQGCVVWRANFPGTAFFTSIVQNVLEAYLSKAVTEAIKPGNQNPICCSCGPGVSCMENPNCECAIASKQFQKKLKIPPVVSFLKLATLKSFFIASQKSRRPSRGTETSQKRKPL